MTLFATKSKMLQILLKFYHQVVTVHNPSIGLLRRGLQLGVVSSYNCNYHDYSLTTLGQTCKTKKIPLHQFEAPTICTQLQAPNNTYF